MIRKAFLVISLVLAVLVPLAFAASADTLDDLLAETQKARAAEAAESKKREAIFLRARPPSARRAQAKGTPQSAATVFRRVDANEVTLADLETKLNSREPPWERSLHRQVPATRRDHVPRSRALIPRARRVLQQSGQSRCADIPEFEQLAFGSCARSPRPARGALETEITTGDGEKRLRRGADGGFIATAGERF